MSWCSLLGLDLPLFRPGTGIFIFSPTTLCPSFERTCLHFANHDILLKQELGMEDDSGGLSFEGCVPAYTFY